MFAGGGETHTYTTRKWKDKAKESERDSERDRDIDRERLDHIRTCVVGECVGPPPAHHIDVPNTPIHIDMHLLHTHG